MGVEKGGAQKGGGPKISRFFPSPASIFALFVSLWVSSRGWWCLKRRGLKMRTIAVLRLSCETPTAPGAAGVSHDSPRAQMCTFQGSGLQKHQQNSTKGPQERERRMKIVAGGGNKKSEILGGPAEGCPAEGISES